MRKYITALAMLSAIGITFSCTPKEDPGKDDPHNNNDDPRVEVLEVTISQSSATLEVGSAINLSDQHHDG